jgi:hypothetical protein
MKHLHVATEPHKAGSTTVSILEVASYLNVPHLVVLLSNQWKKKKRLALAAIFGTSTFRLT